MFSFGAFPKAKIPAKTAPATLVKRAPKRYNSSSLEGPFFAGKKGLFALDGAEVSAQVRPTPIAGPSGLACAPSATESLPPRGCAIAPGEFLAGPENRLVPVACAAVLCPDPSSPALIVLYGPPGTGKSLLAHGLLDCWRKERELEPPASGAAISALAVAGSPLPTTAEWATRAVVISGSDFARTFALSADAAETMRLRARFHNLELFILDDLAQLASKPAAQIELLLTLDALEANGGIAVITARNLPTQIPKLAAPLAGRLLAGLAVPLLPPGPETRPEIVKQFASRRAIVLPAGAARLLGETIKGTAPELQSAVIELAAQAKLAEGPISPVLVRKYLATRAAPLRPLLRDLAQVTAKYFSLKLADLRSPSRQRSVVLARGLAIYLARELAGISLEKIGRYFGGRDHTTILHSFRSTEERVRTDPAARRAAADLRRLIALV